MVNVGDKIKILVNAPYCAPVITGEIGTVTRVTRGDREFDYTVPSSVGRAWLMRHDSEGTCFEITGSHSTVELATNAAITAFTTGVGPVVHTFPGGSIMVEDGDNKWDKGFEIKLKKCECGKEKHGFASHSQWCAVKD